MTDVQARADAHRAVTGILAGRLAPTLAPTLDPGHVADLILDELHDLRWRHVPAPQPITAHGPQGDYDRGAAQARRELDEALARIAANHPKETDR